VGTVVLAPAAIYSWDNLAVLAHWPWFLLVGFLGTVGHMMLIRAYMRATATMLTPYLYAQIAFATLGGWLVFSHVPDTLAWLGIAVIAASGIGNTLLSAREIARQ
jgi:drug/metabolite transporter (DMT)-like permease